MKLSENSDYLMYGTYLSSGNFLEAKQSLVKVINSDCLDNDTLSLLYYLIAKLELELGHTNMAEKYLNDIVKIYPNDDFWKDKIEILKQEMNETK